MRRISNKLLPFIHRAFDLDKQVVHCMHQGLQLLRRGFFFNSLCIMRQAPGNLILELLQ